MGMRSLTELKRMGKTSSGRSFPYFGPASAYLKSALGGIRTHDRRFRRPLLYPTELRALLRVISALCDAAPSVVSPGCIPWTRKQDSSSKRFEKKSPYGRTNLALHHSGSVSMADEPPVYLGQPGELAIGPILGSALVPSAGDGVSPSPTSHQRCMR